MILFPLNQYLVEIYRNDVVCLLVLDERLHRIRSRRLFITRKKKTYVDAVRSGETTT